MTVHYRRTRLSRADELGSAAVSLLVGMGAAALTFYVTRLLLSRERLSDGSHPLLSGPSAARRSLPGTAAPERKG